MNSNNDTCLSLTGNSEEGGTCKDGPRIISEYIKIADIHTRDEIRNFVIDELIYRLKDVYPSISDETINIIADEVIATIDSIVNEADNDIKSIDELIKNEKTYSTLAITALMIIRNREVSNVEVNEVDLTRIIKTIVKNVLKLYGQEV